MSADLSRRAAEALAKLVAAGRIRSAWREGMRAVPTRGQSVRIDWSRGPCLWAEDGPWAPDLSDALTVQGLVLLAREAWGVGSMVYHPTDGAIRAWRFVTFAHGADWLTPARLLGEGHTEAEAAIAALEAAAEVTHADR
jgi:hypothetical protein